jgi:hypothetical protein
VDSRYHNQTTHCINGCLERSVANGSSNGPRIRGSPGRRQRPCCEQGPPGRSTVSVETVLRCSHQRCCPGETDHWTKRLPAGPQKRPHLSDPTEPFQWAGTRAVHPGQSHRCSPAGRAPEFTRNTGKARHAESHHYPLPSLPEPLHPCFFPHTESGKRSKTGKLRSPGPQGRDQDLSGLRTSRWHLDETPLTGREPPQPGRDVACIYLSLAKRLSRNAAAACSQRAYIPPSAAISTEVERPCLWRLPPQPVPSAEQKRAIHSRALPAARPNGGTRSQNVW